MKPVSILILAAGKGVRMKSETPKVLHPVGGTPMVDIVCDTVAKLKPAGVAVIIGHQGERIRSHIKTGWPKTKFFNQNVLDGSGGAVRRALGWLRSQRGDVIVTCGDMPLLQEESLRGLIKAHRQEKNLVTVLTAVVERPFGYGRIVRRHDGAVERIVEELDASPRERNIREINTGTYCFNAKALARVLPKLSNKNAKKEYYLTDTLTLLAETGSIGAVTCLDPNEALGVNRRRDLVLAESARRQRKLGELMDAGVTIIDPASTYVENQVEVGPDTVIYPQTYLKGKTRIGSGCQIGPWTHATNAIVENDVILLASFLDDSIIRRGAKVGPYSRVRPGSDLGPDVHLGNFSEVKKSVVGAGSKVNHLSYLGDAKIGKNVNIGAGTITCNYDGIHKHPTRIDDHAFVGSNANLIAPIRLGAHSVVGAGSSLSRDVPPWALAVERSGAVVKKNWARKKFASSKK
jgi:bifunctional UDP-N-acetylglucosamine pyrophosphorylase/glucosamine-1-phosphate N-acetyltransferase